MVKGVITLGDSEDWMKYHRWRGTFRKRFNIELRTDEKVSLRRGSRSDKPSQKSRASSPEDHASVFGQVMLCKIIGPRIQAQDFPLHMYANAENFAHIG